jgi:O-antigen/teichoic acid export membrane protein
MTSASMCWEVAAHDHRSMRSRSGMASSLGKNVAANFLGKGCLAAVGLIFPPLIARLVGIESYGLVGVYASLNAAFAILDLGLSATLNREMARLSSEHSEEATTRMRDMVRTFELVFWCVGIVLGALVLLVAPLIASRWVHTNGLPREVITGSIRIIGVIICLQWSSILYVYGLFGLQRQASANLIQVAGTTLRQVGGAFILWKVSPTIQAFFVWQAIVAGAQTLLGAIVLSKAIPSTKRSGRFRTAILLANWRFSAGSSLTIIFGIILAQADKVIASKVLSLSDFGYYTLAWTLGNAMTLLFSPVFIAVFPRFTQLASQQDTSELARLYHSSSQLVSVVLLPAAAVLMLFSREVVWAWTGDLTTVQAIQRVVVVVVAGSTLSGLVNVPYALQLAHAWTRLAAWGTGLATVFVIPLSFFGAKAFGMVGAAFGWTLVSGVYAVLSVYLMHRRLLTSEGRRWLTIDVAMPLVGTLVAIIPIRALVPAPHGRGASILLTGAAALAAMTGAILASPIIRQGALDRLKALWSRPTTT